MIRYVDSAGWTWEVGELAAEVAATADGVTVERPSMADAPRAAGGGRLRFAPLADRAAPDPHDGELYFFSRLGSRKLRGYPAAWFQLARADLEALCARAKEIA